MGIRRVWTACVVAAVLGIGGVKAAASPRAEARDSSARTVPRASSYLRVAPLVASPPLALLNGLDGSMFQRLIQSGEAAGPPPGSTRVYGNEISPVTSFYPPGANQRMADDLTLGAGACDAVYYNLGVYGSGPANTTFDVHTELWTDDPCVPGSAPIAGTASTFNALPNHEAYLLEVTIPLATAIPATVWLAATFSRNDVGWFVAGQAEVGSTQNFFSENDTDANPDVCALFQFGGLSAPWAGFWANVYCGGSVPPEGACCNGFTCTQTTQANCPLPGQWQGAFTTCQPNACLTGACCTGVDFEECADTNEPGCPVGLFKPGMTCTANACGLNFEAYKNSFQTGIFNVIDANTKFGDDLTLGAGAPCRLVAYEVLMASGDTPPATFDARVELWTNNDRGTPAVDGDDLPLVVIPGTQRDFNGLAADFSLQRLLAGPFTALELPQKVWMVITTNVNTAGPVFGGLADIGFSQDGFAIFNDPAGPNAWTGPFQFPPNGFDPTNCPGPGCVPAGSFRAIVWCEGAPPMGACCNDLSGTCADGVLSTGCVGRWMQDATCDSNPFDPSCGAHACCYPNPINPNAVVCQDLTPKECIALEGSSAAGLFCVDVTCPIRACINRTGDCFGQHGTTGCDNAFCCEKVCAADPLCCTNTWNSACADRARILCSTDHCAAALPISGEGVFPFDNTTATTDGPIHAACANVGGDEQIEKDVWFCWTSPCSDRVFVRTCGQTTVDTKIGIYDGCACPPTDSDLIACVDDNCVLQSAAFFSSIAGANYLIRVGSYPGAPGGIGTFSITCGPPNNSACPGGGDCCQASGARGCADETCCETVCACDSFCCDVEWDQACATFGFQNNGCGAEVLCACGAECGSPSAGDCCFAHPNPSCSDAVCCQTVCDADAFCCTEQWDEACAARAEVMCTPLCTRVTGACCRLAAGACFEDQSQSECEQSGGDWTAGGDCETLNPPCVPEGGACCNLLTGTCTEDVPLSECLGAQQRWTRGATCNEAACEVVTGACCDHDPFGGCMDGVTRAQCDCDDCEWIKLGVCADIECALRSIPTLNVWGLTILSLMLLGAAKIRFGRKWDCGRAV